MHNQQYKLLLMVCIFSDQKFAEPNYSFSFDLVKSASRS
jgi:hypothetical protein